MAAKQPKTVPRKRPLWQPSDIGKASGVTASADGAKSNYIEIGAQAIYEMRSHPRKARWDQAAVETRAAHRARMQELLNELAMHGFVVASASSPHKVNPALTPAEARLLKAGRGNSH